MRDTGELARHGESLGRWFLDFAPRSTNFERQSLVANFNIRVLMPETRFELA
jgi:hypothetical protein